MTAKIKPLPKFKSQSEEQAFWDTHDTTEYFDMDHPIHMDFSKLKPSTETISLRLPKDLLNLIRTQAQARDIPYQSYMKMKLSDIFSYPTPSL